MTILEEGDTMNDIRLKIQQGVSDLDIADEYFDVWCEYWEVFALYRKLHFNATKGNFPTDEEISAITSAV